MYFKSDKVDVTQSSMLDFEINIRTTNLSIVKKIYNSDTKGNQVQWQKRHLDLPK